MIYDCYCPWSEEYDLHEISCEYYDNDNAQSDIDILITEIFEAWTFDTALGDAARAVIYDQGIPPKAFVTDIEERIAELAGYDMVNMDVECTCLDPTHEEPDNYIHNSADPNPCALWKDDGWFSCKWEWSQADRLLYLNDTAIAEVVETVPKCTCTPEREFYCWKCKVKRDHKTASWNRIVEPPTYNNKWPTPLPMKCRHYGEPITFPNGVTINASSHHSGYKLPEGKPIPDYGLYAYDGWAPDWICTLLPWKDYGLPRGNFDTASREILRFYNMAVEGKTIEVGCMGGHGRTGAMLACMAVAAGVPGDGAVEWVRKNYCDHAIESEHQEWYVEWFDAWIHERELPAPLPPPPPPPPVVKKEEKKQGKGKDKTSDALDSLVGMKKPSNTPAVGDGFVHSVLNIIAGGRNHHGGR